MEEIVIRTNKVGKFIYSHAADDESLIFAIRLNIPVLYIIHMAKRVHLVTAIIAVSLSITNPSAGNTVLLVGTGESVSLAEGVHLLIILCAPDYLSRCRLLSRAVGLVFPFRAVSISIAHCVLRQAPSTRAQEPRRFALAKKNCIFVERLDISMRIACMSLFLSFFFFFERFR